MNEAHPQPGRSAAPNAMTESCAQFGQYRHLVGLVTEPVVTTRRVACVLVNAGLVPKYGPFRLYANLARRLAGEGFRALRFDLGGIGDSRQEYTSMPLRERTQLEIREAVDHLCERYDLDGVVLGGLCSGAEDSFRYAEGDARVRGVVLIDPFSYRTPGWRWRYLRHRIARRSMRVLGVFRPLGEPAAAAPTGESKGKPLVNYKYMEHAESSRILRTMLDRQARTHFVYTGGMQETFNHEGQLADMFEGIDFKGLVTLDHFPRADHTQPLEEDRRQLVDAIVGRLAAAYPAAAP
jgi:pimeloyl-ACP methyl ester carboxylesterase